MPCCLCPFLGADRPTKIAGRRRPMVLSRSRPGYCRCRRLSKKLPFSRTRAGGGFPTHSISCSAGDALGNLPCTAWWALARQRKRGRVVCFGEVSVRESHFVGIGPGLCIGTCTKGRESCGLCGARRLPAAGSAESWRQHLGEFSAPWSRGSRPRRPRSS